MRRTALLLLLAPFAAACDGTTLGTMGAVNAGSLMLVQRTVPDIVVSLVTGRDCSVVWTETEGQYCRPNGLPPPPPYCTRSVGAVDCWAVPPLAIPPRPGLADGPPPVPAGRWPFGRSGLEIPPLGWPDYQPRATLAAAP